VISEQTRYKFAYKCLWCRHTHVCGLRVPPLHNMLPLGQHYDRVPICKQKQEFTGCNIGDQVRYIVCSDDWFILLLLVRSLQGKHIRINVMKSEQNKLSSLRTSSKNWIERIRKHGDENQREEACVSVVFQCFNTRVHVSLSNCRLYCLLTLAIQNVRYERVKTSGTCISIAATF
jgi:hypothetical protein